jgi:hypothetical protein
MSVGDTIAGDVNATNLDAYYNGFLICAAIDSAITTGSAGFLVTPTTSASNAAISAWSGGTWADVNTFVPGISPIVISSNKQQKSQYGTPAGNADGPKEKK